MLFLSLISPSHISVASPLRITGRRNSAFMSCTATSRAQATPLRMPITHRYAATFSSALTSFDCGSNFIPLSGILSEVRATE